MKALTAISMDRKGPFSVTSKKNSDVDLRISVVWWPGVKIPFLFPCN
jgi:hypothetical protein